MKEEIQKWLFGSRNYQEGVALFMKYGRNQTLKKKFQRKENDMFRQKLAYELAKLAGYNAVPVKKKPNQNQSNPNQPNRTQTKTPQSILPLGSISLLK